MVKVLKNFDIEDELFENYRKSNDEISFSRLFRMTEPWLFKLIFKLVGKREAAKDILQDVWRQVIERKYQFNPNRGKFVNYIYAVAKKNALLWYKNESRRNKFDGNFETDIDNPSIPYDSIELREILFKIINKLKNKNYQDAIFQFYFADLEIKEIAARLNTNEQNIKNWLSRAKIKIEEEINKEPGLKQYFESLLSILLITLSI